MPEKILSGFQAAGFRAPARFRLALVRFAPVRPE
jgi:hypothetical protein